MLTNNVSGTNAIKELSALHYIFITFTFAIAIPVCLIQARLFFFAKTKLKRFNPAGAFGAQLEGAHYRKEQIKVALVSDIVAVGAAVCILATAFLFLYKVFIGTKALKLATGVCFSFATANCVVDPFIYGLGNVDTRKMLFRNLIKVKLFIMSKLFLSKVGSGVFTVERNA